jgi:hypothetical protein
MHGTCDETGQDLREIIDSVQVLAISIVFMKGLISTWNTNGGSWTSGKNFV